MIGSLLATYVAVLVVTFLMTCDGSGFVVEEGLVLTPSPWRTCGRGVCGAFLGTRVCWKSWLGGGFVGKKDGEPWIFG